MPEGQQLLRLAADGWRDAAVADGDDAEAATTAADTAYAAYTTPRTVVTGVFEALGDATRRRVLEVLAAGEQAAGDVVAALQAHGPDHPARRVPAPPRASRGRVW